MEAPNLDGLLPVMIIVGTLIGFVIIGVGYGVYRGYSAFTNYHYEQGVEAAKSHTDTLYIGIEDYYKLRDSTKQEK